MTIMDQYQTAKAQHPDMILLFRIGDFYESFGKDAEIAASTCGLTITTRVNGKDILAMAGFPHQNLEVNLHKLLKAGHRIAILDQVTDTPKSAKINRTIV